MQSRLRRIWILLLVTVVLAVSSFSSCAQQIYYTGKLFGYYRIEPDEKTHLRTVDRFLEWRNGADPGWLLGTGDNFGPEFGAGIQLKDDCATQEPTTDRHKIYAPETFYKQERRYAKSAACDNVANFLMTAGYRALVPGREDFIYSSYWLWRLSQSLRTYSDAHNAEIANTNHRMDMLAANLRLTGSAGSCPLLFSPDPLSSHATSCIAAETAPTTFDWLSRLDSVLSGSVRRAIQGALVTSGTANQLLEADQVRVTIVKNQLSIIQAAWGNRCNLGKEFSSDELKQLNNWDAVRTYLQGTYTTDFVNRLQAACSDQQAKDDLNQYWGDLKKAVSGELGKNVAEAKFSELLIPREAILAAQHELLRNINGEMENVGYTVAEDGHDHLLIVGVLGKETMSAVSSENLKICYAGHQLTHCPDNGGQELNVKVLDPVSAVVDAVRAAELVHGHFSKVIVIAQMPEPEAEILASRVRTRIHQISGSPYPAQFVDVVLSEAQNDFPTPPVTLDDVHPDQMTPIFPAPTADFTRSEPTMSGIVAQLSLDSTTGKYKNQVVFQPTFERQAKPITTASEVRRLLQEHFPNADRIVPCLKARSPGLSASDCTYETVLAVLASLERVGPKTDVVLLERRDFYLGQIPNGYGGGSEDLPYCAGTESNKLNDCLLRVALDRVLWKGDFLEQVAVTGTDLGKILDTSAAQASGEDDLKVTDLSQQGLVSYGISQSQLTNLTKLSSGDDPSWIPADHECRQADQNKGDKILYCVNGRPIIPDQIYWVAMSDGLSEDNSLYTQLGALGPERRRTSSDFLTEASVSAFRGFGGKPTDQSHTDVEAIATENNQFEQQRIYQVDFNKLVLSFNNNHALGPTDQVPAQLQGAADSRAAVPHSQDVDLEASLRLIDDHVFFQSAALGTLTSFAYERSIKGNLSGSPETVSYAQNNATFGAFGQYTLRRNPGIRSRALPRDLLVLTPHQFQTQVNNARLFIAFTAKDTSGQPIPGQLAIPLPFVNSFSDKVGYRHEWGNRPLTSWNLDGGSYAEGGFEYSVQNNILNSITLANGATTLRCIASAKTDIGTCFKGAKSTFPIGPTTTIVGHPDAQTLHTPGAYWDVHLSRKIDFGKKLSFMKNPFALVSDSQGESFFGRSGTAVLSTQTKYAVTWNSSLNFPVWGNLSVGPTYNVFFYQPQLSSLHEQIRTFSVALRWYFARDQRTPVLQQLGLSGPASADQTKSSTKSK